MGEIFELETGAGQNPARDFAGSRVRNPALFVICGILRDFCGIYPANLSRKSCEKKIPHAGSRKIFCFCGIFGRWSIFSLEL